MLAPASEALRAPARKEVQSFWGQKVYPSEYLMLERTPQEMRAPARIAWHCDYLASCSSFSSMYLSAVDWSASAFDFFHDFGGFAGTNALSNHMDVIPYTSPFGNGLSRRYLNDISHLRFEIVLASRCPTQWRPSHPMWTIQFYENVNRLDPIRNGQAHADSVCLSGFQSDLGVDL